VLGDRVDEVVVNLDPYQPSVLDYPSIAYTSFGPVDVVVSFDGLYTIKLFNSTCLRVRGVRGWLVLGSDALRAVFVGIREVAQTYALSCS
jgi:hypothetical protein